MLLREVAFYASTLYGLARKHLAGHKWSTRIAPYLILGALPLRSDWNALEQKEHITHIISLLEPFEVKSFVVGPEVAASRGIKHLSLPVRDFVAAPTLEQINLGIQFIDSCRQSGGTVYVHCKAGRTRSAIIVACYLMHLHGFTCHEAWQFIKQKRPQIRLSKSQNSVLSEFERLNSTMRPRDTQ